MADKIINLRIDVKKINKAFLYEGEKGTYLDCTLFFNEEQDQYGANGMIVQSVPKKVFEAEKDKPKDQRTKGAILGNAKVFGSAGSRESIPGSQNGTSSSSAPKAQEIADDLPF